MSEKRWKAQERRVARLLGGKRNHTKGSAAPDVQSTWASIEVKDRKSLPQWLYLAIAQARGNATRRQLPLAVLTTPSTTQVLVVMDMRDFTAWFGDLKKEVDNG